MSDIEQAQIEFALTELEKIQNVLADDWGVRSHVALMHPAKALQGLANAQRDLDYREAYLAVLTSGQSEHVARRTAEVAVVHLTQVRARKVQADD